MTTTLDALGEAVTALAELWPDEEFGTGGLEGIPGGRLSALIHAAGTLHRLTDAVITQIAAETERQSRPELGPDSLAKTARIPQRRDAPGRDHGDQ